MRDGFINLPALVETYDGRNVVHRKALYFWLGGKLYRIPVGAKSDGCSSPPFAWPLIPPFGDHWPASNGHDADYQNTLEKFIPNHPHLKFTFSHENDPLPPGKWVKVDSNEYWGDRLILKLMKACNVWWLKRWIIYAMLRDFGFIAFRADRRACGE